MNVHIDVIAFSLSLTILHNQVHEVKENTLIFSFRCSILKAEFMAIYSCSNFNYQYLFFPFSRQSFKDAQNVFVKVKNFTTSFKKCTSMIHLCNTKIEH